MTATTPEIANSIKTGGYNTNVHIQGEGKPVIFIHGSGPGVTAWANWRLIIPQLARDFRVVAPDMVGFGYTDRPENISYTKETWVRQVKDLMDTLGIERADLVGNSFGGGISLAFALQYPERVGKIILMGAAGVKWEVTPGLAAVWGYEPSFEAMRNLLDIFAYDRSIVTDELAQLRYEASIRPGFQESFRTMFPHPFQRWLDALASDEDELRTLDKEVLLIHGREDRVVPLESSLRLLNLIPKAQLHVFGQCGHWTQIEKSADFTRLTRDFFTG
ncbi:2,6-dioxo-6-phenylhexa-3-enoate hydrolase [Acidocella aquatica]|uniref:2,6-dioxo-6-phenylhexa-3-enoate hydrolase n=1 Tax=Acidocella aquatica TaxID=1922313 RepID=A0ABQ6AAU6_9PROT|nr:alpha/beta hydrolase [Acidocella aquatica]GLR67190.1 2,6-dioxo-6-phenylhexa-3-enoate hydrolase [Acidocella aquatica]